MRYLLPLLAATALAGGCADGPYMSKDRLKKGLVVVCPGIEGAGLLNQAICEGLDAGGVDWAIDVYDWTSPYGPLYNLRAEQRNREMADRLAARVMRYQHRYPQRPVFLLGHSGGGAIAVWAAEMMPSDQPLDGLVLLSPALSPTYRLVRSLANCRRGIVSFRSARDWVFLGAGTAVCGTMDGRHTSSAGRLGFQVPQDDEAAGAYARLFQVAWHRDMAEVGHTGGHLSGAATYFVTAYVAPLLFRREWTEPFIRDTVGPKPSSGPATRPSARNRRVGLPADRLAIRLGG